MRPPLHSWLLAVPSVTALVFNIREIVPVSESTRVEFKREYLVNSGPGPGLVTLFLMGFLASSSFPEKHGKGGDCHHQPTHPHPLRFGAFPSPGL